VGSVVTVSARGLNRALLQRQMLLERRNRSVTEAIERCVALQAQEPRDPYVALWSRVDGFRAERLSSALEQRRAVRMTLLRGTLHLVTARDAVGLRPLVQPGIEATFQGSSPLRTAIDGVGRDELLDAIGVWLREQPRTRADLVRAMSARWPTLDADAQSWSGIRGMRAIFDRLAPSLRELRDEEGRVLWDVAHAPLPDPELDVPVRFLPEYDNAVLGYRDRARIVPPASDRGRRWGGERPRRRDGRRSVAPAHREGPGDVADRALPAPLARGPSGDARGSRAARDLPRTRRRPSRRADRRSVNPPLKR
jgi:hypothetical protein